MSELKLTGAEIAKNKDRVVELLSTIPAERGNVQALISWLSDNTDFFVAPASRNHHLACEGGLALHSLHVYDTLLGLVTYHQVDVGDNSVIITALLHDLCKVNYYVKGFRNVRVGSGPRDWEQREVWDVQDQYPLGHGEKSVYLASRFLDINPVEALAIRWHMGTPLTVDYALTAAYQAAMRFHPLVPLLHIADFESAYVTEEAGIDG